jgi:hypothetical protein
MTGISGVEARTYQYCHSIVIHYYERVIVNSG